MANVLLTINMITREAVRLWKNTNAFLMNVDMQYDDSFAQTGAKIGTALRIRLPNDFTVRSGAGLSVQDTSEQSTTLTLATQKGVDVAFSTADRLMSLDDYAKRILAPAINNLAGNIALDLMTGSEGGIANAVANVDGSNNVLSPVITTILSAGALLDVNSAGMDRKIVLDPFTDARVVAALSGLFNPTPDISKQYKTGAMKNALGFDFMRDQTVIKHTAGSFTAGTVNGAGQIVGVGSALTVNAITGTLNQGDIITIAGVNAVNRVTKGSSGQLRQFVLTQTAVGGATQLFLYPAIIPPASSVAYAGLSYTAAQYQTVTASPAASAVISLFTLAGVTYRKSIAYAPDAITMVVAPLFMPNKGVVEAARHEMDDVSMRSIVAYLPGTDQIADRLDVLFGYLFIRPEWVVAVCDTVSS
jgi:hypothetical protein